MNVPAQHRSTCDEPGREARGDPCPFLNPQALPGTLDPDSLAAALVQAALAIPQASGVRRTCELAATLHSCHPGALGREARLAFWINIYNSLVRHAFHHLQLRGSVVGNLRVFARAAWLIGGERFSLDIIEHGLLRGNARVPPLQLFRTLRPGDARLAAATGGVDPRIHFALNCGARSCPPVRVYHAQSLQQQLDDAARDYFAAHAELDQHAQRVRLPRLMKYFRRDFGGRSAALHFAARYFAPEQGSWLLRHAARVKVDYSTYDWTIVPL